MTQEETKIVKSFQQAVYNNYKRNITLDEFHTIVGHILERREIEAENKSKKNAEEKR